MLGVLASFVILGAADVGPSPAAAALGELASFAGVWESEASAEREHTVEFRLIANGTALVENWTMRGGRKSMTVYTLEGDELYAVHYCPQGNQPRLKFAGKSEDGALKFEFLDGANLDVSGASHQFRFAIARTGPDAFRRSEAYVDNEASPEDLASAGEGETIRYVRKSE